MPRSRVILAAGLSATFALLAATPARAAATIVIDDADPVGQGLNDATPVSPVGGNAATTLGAARLGVFEQAAALWGSRLTSVVPIHVATQFTALACGASSAVLASTGASTAHRDFPSAPVAATWYPQALANSLAQVDLDPTSADITTQFNAALGTTGCVPGTSWYLGYDGHPAAGQIDMLTIVLHELAHGLGFQAFDDLATGEKLLGDGDDFLLNARQLGATPTSLDDMSDAQRVTASESDPDLYWGGAAVDADASTLSAGLISGHVRLHAPATQAPGSSVSHYSVAVTPNELMEPNYTGPNHNLALTLDLLRDLGWHVVAPPSPAVPALPGGGRWLLALGLAGAAVSATTRSRGGRRRRRRCGP